MRSKLLILMCVPAFLVGCAADRDDRVRRGTPITHVQAEYGAPDVISDASGDEVRFYLPTRRPVYEWPADAPRTFYYLERDLAVTFVAGRAVNAGPMGPEVRDGTLLPLVGRSRRRAVAGRREGCGDASGDGQGL